MSGIVTAAVIVGGSGIYAANKASSATKKAAGATLEASESAEALNRERWAEAQGYLDPYAGRSNIAAQQMQAELGLPQFQQQGPPQTQQMQQYFPEFTQQGEDTFGPQGQMGPFQYGDPTEQPAGPYAAPGQEFTPRDMSDIPGWQAPIEAGSMSEVPGYQSVMDESLRAAEQSAISSGSTAYGGRRLKAAGQVGAGVQESYYDKHMLQQRFRETQNQSYYNNYMNMLQNLSSPTVATNLSSMGMNQGIAMGNQNIGATNTANNYRLEGTAATNAAVADFAGGMVELGSAYMNRPQTPPPQTVPQTNTSPMRI
jgi:hypothetical protein